MTMAQQRLPNNDTMPVPAVVMDMESTTTRIDNHNNNHFVQQNTEQINFCELSRPTAEEYAADAMGADMDQWITYDPQADNNTPEAFSSWLSNNLPSNISRADGIGWIAVQSPDALDMTDDDDQNPVNLQNSWEHMRESKRTISLQSITELAKIHNVTDGKWMFHTSTGLKVDHLWTLVARGVVEGRCGISAKVSPYNPDDNSNKHVVCIYNYDFTDKEQVMELESSIRKLGLKCQLMYKPDIYTHLGVYRNNEWGLRPTIYRSVYDVIRGCSIVSETQSYPEMSHHHNLGHM